MIKEKRRKKRRLKQFLQGLLFVLIFSAIVAFLVLKVFVVKEVKVEGNKLYNEDLITEAVLNDEYSWNSLYVWLKYTFIDTQELPFIDTMEIKLHSPSGLTIKVYEKGMLGYLHIPSIDQMAYFDKEGFVVETSNRIIEGVPMIAGVSCDEVVLFEKLPIGDQELRDMLTLTQTLKREGLEPDGIHFGAAYAPVLYYGNIEVWLGSVELLTQKVDRLNEILPMISGVEGVLHMENWTEETTNTIFEKIEVEEDTEGTENTEDSEDKEDEAQNADDPKENSSGNGDDEGQNTDDPERNSSDDADNGDDEGQNTGNREENSSDDENDEGQNTNKPEGNSSDNENDEEQNEDNPEDDSPENGNGRGGES